MDYAPRVSLGVYVHIPYCLQRCPYCDFATYEVSRIPGSDSYLELVLAEIKLRTPALAGQAMQTLYFGGGTPSLLPPEHLLAIKNALTENLHFTPDAELTLEINPATLDPAKIETLIKGGFNRFSVGAQTFSDRLLKIAGRKHSAQDTVDTLQLLRSFGVNYSFDLLFALPTQTMDELKLDLDRVADFSPPHVSPYCLTVPESNPMSKNRPLENVQVDMFHLIDHELRLAGLVRYEISNYARPGRESRHNLLYWKDESYLGLGLSAHSYLRGGAELAASEAEAGMVPGYLGRGAGEFGTRFWNPNQYQTYEAQIRRELLLPVPAMPFANLPVDHQEQLACHESLTDFCHTSLRLSEGLSLDAVERKFGSGDEARGLLVRALVADRLRGEKVRFLIEDLGSGRYTLNDRGWILSNAVFQELTFSVGEV